MYVNLATTDHHVLNSIVIQLPIQRHRFVNTEEHVQHLVNAIVQWDTLETSVNFQFVLVCRPIFQIHATEEELVWRWIPVPAKIIGMERIAMKQLVLVSRVISPTFVIQEAHAVITIRVRVRQDSQDPCVNGRNVMVNQKSIRMCVREEVNVHNRITVRVWLVSEVYNVNTCR